jgi:DNA-binding PucR family transcriptional regulator
VIAPTPLVRCNEHVTQMWLHAEPSMRQRLCQQLLEPLLAETPNSREILSDTLLAWLETRDSAPAIAAKLDVHPQTVRYRWKRINELFGDALHDPEFILLVTMVLKTSVPMWKAGNQSDFERFRDRKPPGP